MGLFQLITSLCFLPNSCPGASCPGASVYLLKKPGKWMPSLRDWAEQQEANWYGALHLARTHRLDGAGPGSSVRATQKSGITTRMTITTTA